MVAFNFALHVTSLWILFVRYGPDTTAYVNQASQFWSGQTNYNLISSIQGPSYYPAGHLWHYSIIYKIFLSTDNGETILRFIHFSMHSV